MKRLIRLNVKSFIGQMNVIKINIDISQSIDKLRVLIK